MATTHPFIHRPTLELQIKNRLHERDRSQAQLVLMICALGSASTNDLRTHESVDGVATPGHQYFSIVQDSWSLPFSRPTLAELQTCVVSGYHRSAIVCNVLTTFEQLMAMYCTSIFGDAARGWIYLGTGVRIAEAMGAHRKSSCPDEIWKRTFWCVTSF